MITSRFALRNGCCSYCDQSVSFRYYHNYKANAGGLSAVPTAAQAQSKLPIKPGMQAMIMGWGAQDDSNHLRGSSKLKSLRTSTIECPEEYRNGKFICIGAPLNVGGPCRGDEGGKCKSHTVFSANMCTLTTYVVISACSL